jgi:16S rRNA (cytosine967-C5)-methyltransferase
VSSRRGPGSSLGRSRRTPRRSAESSVRVAAAWVLERTLASSAPATSFLAGVQERFDERDKGLLLELVMGSLRWLRLLDHVVAAASHRSFDTIEPALRPLLRVAAYQLLFLQRVPAYAAVDEAVEQARSATHRGGASFVNAVLRRIARDPALESWPVDRGDEVARWGVRWSHPDFLVRRWLSRYGRQRTLALLEANNRPRPPQLLAFRDRGGRELLAERLIDEGLEVEPSRLSSLGVIVRQGDPLASAVFRDGDCYLQNEASQVASLLPPPRPGEKVLDAAAAPGGKSFALLAWDPQVRLLCADHDLARLRVLRQNLERLRRRLPVVVADAGETPWGSGFDRVVLDLPCSGTGTFRKHPELKWRLSEEEIGRLSRQAERLLVGSGRHVAPGGLLVAITCSIEPEEHEEVVEALLARAPQLRPLELAPRVEPHLAAHVEAPGRWRLLPGGDHDGFTVTVLERGKS